MKWPNIIEVQECWIKIQVSSASHHAKNYWSRLGQMTEVNKAFKCEERKTHVLCAIRNLKTKIVHKQKKTDEKVFNSFKVNWNYTKTTHRWRSREYGRNIKMFIGIMLKQFKSSASRLADIHTFLRFGNISLDVEIMT